VPGLTVSARGRVVLVVVAAGAAVVAAVIAVTLVTRTSPADRRSRVPAPPLARDPTAPAHLTSEVRAALSAWPSGTVRRLRILAGQHPSSGLVELELGLALTLSGQPRQAQAALRAAKRVDPDSPSAVEADDVLHPNTPRGEPPFVPSFTRPRTAVQRELTLGAQLQAAFRRVSAERAFEAAVGLAPNDPEALTAAAVGLYDKDHPERAFSRLGPLSRRFPRSQTVRFHLGLLLIYLRQLPQARRELQLAVADGPGTLLASRARLLLKASRNR
jgi:tetratricopeptide (TPR) repeat protein